MQRRQSGDVLRPYSGAPKSLLQSAIGMAGWGFLVVFCFAYGLFYAITTPYLLLPFTIPLVVLSLVVIWALPDRLAAPIKSLEWLFYIFFIALVLWPNYIALALPGLPWITIIRLTGFPLAIVLLICVSISQDFRTRSAEALAAVPLVWKLFTAFTVLEAISVAFSATVSVSFSKLIVAQIGWTSIFFVSCYIFLKPRRVEVWAYLVWVLALAVSIIGVDEFRHSHVPWAGHLPKFLGVGDDPLVQKILAGTARAATGIYRVQSTFSTSLGLAEYIGLALPFVLNFAIGRYNFFVKVAAAVSIPFLFWIVIVTDSRLGIVGFFLTFLLYVFAWSATRWRRMKSDLIGPAVTLAYPVIFVAAVAAVFSIGRLRARVWGNGPQAASTESRKIQYQQGFEKIMAHPWGYGIGRAAETLGMRDEDGTLTIDTYYIVIALEYGIIGFFIYYTMIILLGFETAKYSLWPETQGDRDLVMLTPLWIAIFNFLVIKSVFSNQDNHPLFFMMMGMAMALIARVKKARTVAAAPAISTPALRP